MGWDAIWLAAFLALICADSAVWRALAWTLFVLVVDIVAAIVLKVESRRVGGVVDGCKIPFVCVV